jgi:hypothetical protein
MIMKSGVLVAMLFLVAPVASLAQNSSTVSSVESLNLADIADDSIVVLSKDEAGVSGYVHVKYAYIHADCPGGLQLVHYSGSAFDPNDRSLRRREYQQCSQQSEARDGE